MTLSAFSGSPESWTRLPAQTLFSLSSRELYGLQLGWAQERFARLQDRIPALESLAEKQGVKVIDSFDTLATILFTHQVYKNYPFAFIERKQFQELTRWLNKLTAHDLSGLDMRGVSTIDEWLQRLDDAGMFVFHSTGTSGKLSFFPSEPDRKVCLGGRHLCFSGSIHARNPEYPFAGLLASVPRRPPGGDAADCPLRTGARRLRGGISQPV